MPALLFESHFRKIPVPFRQFMGDALNCDLVVYWLYNARRGEAPPSIADQLAAISQPSSSELYDAIIRVLRRARTTTCAPRVACGQARRTCDSKIRSPTRVRCSRS